ncbi:MAG: threonine--tRNA ligase [bacterium]
MSNNQKHLEYLRHSLAHLLAAAVMGIWPDTKRTIGPSIENGFYYDFEFKQPISDKDLPKIEKRMKRILTTWKSFEKNEVTAQEAKKEFANNPYKLELIDEIVKEKQPITIYQSGEFRDLCRGGHVDDIKKMNPKAFKLTKTAGAYWRGDEKNTMLTRIYGVAFETEQELTEYLKVMEEAEKRDHRKLGQELDLFAFSELVGSGLPLFMPKGTIVMQEVNKLLNELKTAKGYQMVDIPHLAKNELYKVSGHWDKFKDDIFHVKGKTDQFVLKPMNCPHHIQIYQARPHSYRDLPIQYAEITKQYRDEQSGELHGLSRVRSITIDDAHIFCRSDQILDQAKGAFDIISTFLKTFGLKTELSLSVRDPKAKDKYLGTDKVWQQAEDTLARVLKVQKATYTREEGEAAFYGPKIDFVALDSLGRRWQLSTIQLDFNLPERFQLDYTDDKGKKVGTTMLHIAVAGAFERFFSIIIEHYAGAFPVWLSPVQAHLITVGSAHQSFAKKLAKEFMEAGIRVEVDDANETVGNKIRKAVKLKVPYMLVLGDKEVNAAKLNIRARSNDAIITKSKSAFIKHVCEEIAERRDREL